jgi:hypothetical protein
MTTIESHGRAVKRSCILSYSERHGLYSKPGGRLV